MAGLAYRQVSCYYFTKHLDAAIADLRQGGSQVVLITPAYSPPVGDADPDMLAQTAQTIRERAAAGGLALIDLYERTRAAQATTARSQPFSEVTDRRRGLTPAGQTLAACLALQALVEPAPLCEATIAAASGKADGHGCQVSELRVTPDEVSFRRKDDALPVWPPADAVAGFKDLAGLKELNRYRLVVTGLKAGAWKLRVEAMEVGTFTAQQLADGVELCPENGPWRSVAATVRELTLAQETIVEALAKTVQAPAMPDEAQPQRQALVDKIERLIRDRQKTRDKAAQAPTWIWTLHRVD